MRKTNLDYRWRGARMASLSRLSSKAKSVPISFAPRAKWD
jgi:hypothetical protein